MLVDFKTIIDMAQKGGFAIPAFNVYNMETVMGVLDAAEEAQTPVIMQVYPRLFSEKAGYFVAPVILAAASKAGVPVCFHLDHGPSLSVVNRALRCGATGIMLDGSPLEFDENVRLTKSVVDICADLGVGVEGELGHIGSANDNDMDEFTNPDDAAKFVEQTGVTALAVLIGNAHGRYKKPPKLDIDRVRDIYAATNNTPLVLHGGSGIPDEDIKLAIKAGIRKINFATDACWAFIDGIKAELDKPDHAVAIDNFMKGPIDSVKKFALSRIALCGSHM